MQAVPAAWKTAALVSSAGSSGGYSPVWLVELIGVNRYFATRSVPVSSLRLLGDGREIGSGVLLGEIAQPYGLDLADGSLSEFGIAEEEEGGNVRISGGSVAFRNEHDFLAALAVGQLDNTTVRLQLSWDGLGPADALPVWSGVIDRVQVTQDRVTLELIDGTFRKHRNLSVPLGAQYFVATPAANRNNKIPIILGVNTDVETVQVAGAAVGSTKYALTTGSTALLLVEYGAAFPASGTITIEAETGVTYTAQRLFTSPADGKTYLELSGLIRGAPVSHAAGVTVTLTSVVYQHLIGYEVSDLDAVRENGVLLTSGYTQAVVVADRNTSVLNFTTQRGVITVDVNAANISMTNLLTNGGFEAGTLAGWTTGAGATTAVGTSNPTPEEGTYWASLQGIQNAYKDLYQEFDTVSGDDYYVEWSYYDEDVNLLSNGGFETGDLTGWTVTAAAGIIEVTSIDPAEGVFALGLRVNPQSNNAGGIPFMNIRLHTDMTVLPFTIYTVSFHFQSYSYTYYQTGGFSLDISSLAEVGAGTILDPNAYGGVGGLVGREQGRPGSGVIPTPPWRTRSFTLTTGAETTMRISLYAFSSGLSQTVFASFARDYAPGIPPPVRFDGIRVQQSGTVDTARHAYQLGTPSTPSLYSTEEQDLSLMWRCVRKTFRATDSRARLTLQSQYKNTTARRTWLDHVSVQRRFRIHSGSGGENPTEAMRYLIQTFLPAYQIDEASFATAYERLIAWRYAAVLRDPGDSKDLLQRMGDQCNSWIFPGANGQLKIIHRDESREAVYGFTVNNIIEGTFDSLDEPLENIATEIYVWFGARTGGTANSADFQGVTYCTPTESTHPQASFLTTLCASAKARYQYEKRLNIFGDFLADFYTANLLLGILVHRHTRRSTHYTFETWLDAAVLELGDIIVVTDPRQLADLAIPQYAEVIECRVIPQTQTVRLVAKALTNAGWSADWNYNPLILETGGWNTEFNEV